MRLMSIPRPRIELAEAHHRLDDADGQLTGSSEERDREHHPLSRVKLSFAVEVGRYVDTSKSAGDVDHLIQRRRTSMLYLRERSRAFWSFPFLILLNGCGAKPECDTFETRNAVLQIVSDDHDNALAVYAAKNSNAVKEKSSNATSEAEKSANLESTKPLYLLGETIVTTSTSADKLTVKCSGSMSVTIGDTKASKEVDFTVQQSSDGKIAVSVAPFQF